MGSDRLPGLRTRLGWAVCAEGVSGPGQVASNSVLGAGKSVQEGGARMAK